MFGWLKRIFGGGSNQVPTPVIPSGAVMPTTPIVSNTVPDISKGNLTLGELVDFTPDELVQLRSALNLVNVALSDQKFIDILMNAKFDNTTDTNTEMIAKLTAPIVVTHLACENLGWWATNRSHTIAREDSDGSITFNRPFFDEQSSASVANTLIHETCHRIGYSHSSASDSMSVPYQVGNLLEGYLNTLGIN